jgi:hypothetical protein
MWASGHNRQNTLRGKPTREAAMAGFAKRWRGEQAHACAGEVIE